MLINLLKFWLAGAAPTLWPFVLSLLVLGVVLVLPNGLLDMRNRSRSWMTGIASGPGRLSRLVRR